MEFSEVHEIEHILAQSIKRNGFDEKNTSSSLSKAKRTSRGGGGGYSANNQDTFLLANTYDESPGIGGMKATIPADIASLIFGQEESENDLMNDINSIMSTDKKQVVNDDHQKEEVAGISESTVAATAAPVETDILQQENSDNIEKAEAKLSVSSSSASSSDSDESDENSEYDSDSSIDEDSSELDSSPAAGATQAYDEVPDETIKNSFAEVLVRKISLIKSGSEDNPQIQTKKSYHNPNATQIEVYFFCTPFNLKIGVNDNMTVAEFIKVIIEVYMEDPNSKKALMKYPKYPHAYQLRIRDDDEFKPEPNFPPLDMKRQFKLMKVDSIVLMEDDKFKPPVRSMQDQAQERAQEMSQQKGLMLLNITILDTGVTSWLQFQLTDTIRDVLDFLITNKKHKINLRETIVSCLDPSDDISFDVDLSTPIKQLLSSQITIRKKIYADKTNVAETRPVQAFSSLPRQVITSEPISIMNLVKYEEFQVIKINSKGKKQQRILGLDQHKITNINRQIQAQSIGFLDRIFSDPVTGTKNPSRQIKHIQSVVEQENGLVVMKVNDTEQQYEKSLRYLIENYGDRKRLLKKLEGLIELSKKDTKKDQGYMTYAAGAGMSHR